MTIALSPLFQGLLGHSSGLHLQPRVNGQSADSDSALSAGSAKTESVASGTGANEDQDTRAIKLLQSSLRYHLGSFSRQAGASSSGTTSGATAPQSSEAPSADKTAKNILGFITQRLNQAAANGADQSQLDGLLNQARDGVQKGFQEARDQLKSLGLLSPELDKSIGKSLSSVTQGLDKLQQQVDGATASSGSAGATGSGSADVVSSQAAAIESTSRESLSLKITTKDGDRVTIQLDQRQYDGASISSSQNASGQTLQAQTGHLFSGHYRISVKGHLDASEQKSITDLLDKVQSLSNTFFNGNVQDAFKQAQSLGIDGTSLAKFSLSLSYSKSVRAAAYSQTAPAAQSLASLQPIGQLASGVQGASQQAAQSGVSANDFASLFQQLLGAGHQQATQLGQSVAPKDFLSQFLQTLLSPADSKASSSAAGHTSKTAASQPATSAQSVA
ncbi:DUF5610 domain-containing protein [Mangrovitalea sediminis]|uniref:DUF5610 domain-containing protein n=1 Tax=Mangrovitalea sediminis TaxID=1982043 RepID=UPI000BE5C38D|nr:DUF5610 domain-containing protein [Mangrovitalea sediminis]